MKRPRAVRPRGCTSSSRQPTCMLLLLARRPATSLGHRGHALRHVSPHRTRRDDQGSSFQHTQSPVNVTSFPRRLVIRLRHCSTTRSRDLGFPFTRSGLTQRSAVKQAVASASSFAALGISPCAMFLPGAGRERKQNATTSIRPPHNNSIFRRDCPKPLVPSAASVTPHHLPFGRCPRLSRSSEQDVNRYQIKSFCQC